MKQLKKTILTLVALLAVTTGAWAADVITVTWSSGDTYENNNSKDGVTLSGDIVQYDGFEWQLAYDKSMGTFTTELGNFTKIEITGGYIYGFSGEGWSGRTWTGNAAAVPFSGYLTDDDGDRPWTITFTIAPASSAASSGPEVAWNKAEKTGQFTMPGGNVTLEPEYYPQAAVADGGVTAADADARATTDDPLVKVDATKLTGAKKLMYFVSNSGTTAPAYDAEGWTDQLPTAEGFTQQGIVYVWYYPVGTDEGQDGATATYSDGDICKQSITARIAPEPTYAVTFAEGVNPEPPAQPEWTASPNAGVKKGTEVTVTYTGTKKVIGVKAEKKAAEPAYPLLSEATTSDYGKVVCAAGHLHEAKTAVPDGCTAVGILGKVTETGHGLILALENARPQDWYTINGWKSVTSYAGTTLKVLPDDEAARGTALTSYTTLGETAVSDWAVAQQSDYEAIFTNLGSTTGDSDGKTYDGNVNAYITTGVGGTALSGECWSATDDDGDPWYFSGTSWSHNDMSQSHLVWPVLGF